MTLDFGNGVWRLVHFSYEEAKQEEASKRLLWEATEMVELLGKRLQHLDSHRRAGPG